MKLFQLLTQRCVLGLELFDVVLRLAQRLGQPLVRRPHVRDVVARLGQDSTLALLQNATKNTVKFTNSHLLSGIKTFVR